MAEPFPPSQPSDLTTQLTGFQNTLRLSFIGGLLLLLCGE